MILSNLQVPSPVLVERGREGGGGEGDAKREEERGNAKNIRKRGMHVCAVRSERDGVREEGEAEGERVRRKGCGRVGALRRRRMRK